MKSPIFDPFDIQKGNFLEFPPNNIFLSDASIQVIIKNLYKKIIYNTAYSFNGANNSYWNCFN